MACLYSFESFVSKFGWWVRDIRRQRVSSPMFAARWSSFSLIRLALCYGGVCIICMYVYRYTYMTSWWVAWSAMESYTNLYAEVSLFLYSLFHRRILSTLYEIPYSLFLHKDRFRGNNYLINLQMISDTSQRSDSEPRRLGYPLGESSVALPLH